jgi:hypothetical protein
MPGNLMAAAAGLTDVLGYGFLEYIESVLSRTSWHANTLP